MLIHLKTWVSVLAAAAFVALSPVASAAELTVYSAGAVKAALSLLVQDFQKGSGHRLTVEYAPVGTLLRRMVDGQPDVVLLTQDVMPEVELKGWTVAGSANPVGAVGVGVAVQDGHPVPDISTPEALKRSLLTAKSITYVDPEKGTSGKHFVQVLQRLGIAEEMRGRTTLGDSGYVVEPVARGDIEIGIQQITEILPVAGARLVGPLPEPLQKITVYTAALGAQAHEVAAAQAFLAYLRGGPAKAVFSSKGFAPVP